MATASPPPPGLSDQIRALGDRLLASLQGRIELISIELQEEKFRLVQTFVWISTVVFVAMLAITFASITLVYAVDEGMRLIVLGGLTTVYTVIFIATVIASIATKTTVLIQTKVWTSRNFSSFSSIEMSSIRPWRLAKSRSPSARI